MFKVVLNTALFLSLFFFTACGDKKKKNEQEIQSEAPVQNNEEREGSVAKNKIPLAYAGEDQKIYVYEKAILDGLKSRDPEGEALTYNWFFKSKPGDSNVSIKYPSDANTSFFPDKSGLYIVELVVNDGIDDSEASIVEIRAFNSFMQIPSQENKVNEDNDNVFKGNENIPSNTSNLTKPSASSSKIFSDMYYQYAATDSNTSVSLFLNGYIKLNAENLLYKVVLEPKYGKIDGTFPNLIYASNTNNLQKDCFIVEVFNGSKSINQATIFIENVSETLSSQVADIDIEELGVYFHVNEQNYYEKLTLLKSNGRIEQSGISYEFVPVINQDHIGSMYITLTNTDESDLRYAKVFFFLDTSIEQSKNSFFNEYGQYIAVRGIGSGDLEADFWQIDEPDYLDGHIVANLQQGILDQTNHIEVGSSEDVSMALGFEIENFRAGSSLSFRLDLGVENTGSGLSQIDTTSKSEIFYNVTLQDPSLFLCE